MKASQQIYFKQVLWALRHNIELFGSKKTHGRKAYTSTLEENLFEPLLPSALKDIKRGTGGELVSHSGNLPKMHAVHSSSVLGVNIFHYWLRVKQVHKIAAACGFCDYSNQSSQNILFESQFPISPKFRFSPNIDIIIENSLKSKYKVFAVECKFSEAYSSRGHSGIDPKYLDLENIWDNVPDLRKFASSISPEDESFTYLHPAQLVKHILGLKQEFGKDGFRLLYLWYDCLGQEGVEHRKEIEKFIKVTKASGVCFHALSYQELIIKLANEHKTEHPEYINYISERYL